MKRLLILFLLLTLPVLAGDGIDRLQFQPGADYGSVADSIARGNVYTWVAGAGRGQRMTVVVTSVEDNAVFEIYGPRDEVLVRDARAWSGTLPSDGDYHIIVAPTRGNTTYRMIVHIR